MQRTRACRLSIYLGNAEIFRHRSLAEEILLRARRCGLSGATTVQGVEGYGRSTHLHEQGGWQLVERTPVTVYLVDSAERIRAFLPELDAFSGRCAAVLDWVTVPEPD